MLFPVAKLSLFRSNAKIADFIGRRDAFLPDICYSSVGVHGAAERKIGKKFDGLLAEP